MDQDVSDRRADDPGAVFPTTRLFGLDFANGESIGPIVDGLFAGRDVRPDSWRCVVTPNVDHLVRYQRHAEELEAAAHASIVMPDGMPIIWASRLLRRPLRSRLAGSDLFPALWQRCCAAGTPIVVIASNEEVASRLREANPHARCIVPPMFSETDRGAVDAVVTAAAEAAEAIDARFLAVGVSMPKHHRIANGLRRRWAGRYAGTPTVMLVGASPDFAVGLAKRAPRWMQRSGVEWVHRLLGDPRRMAKRYLVDDVAFVRLVWREWRSPSKGT
jgi:N-acetylglucosaminyldiphosphoundecaprenol N-acetyl-beta-D-mannosaminyltransferase